MKDSYNDLLSFPSLKLQNKNEWAEEDGSEYDLENPKLNTQDVILKFHLPEIHYEEFMMVIKESTYANFYFERIGKTFRLRYVSMPKIECFRGIISVEVKMSNDNPFSGYIYTSPILTTDNSNAYLDGKNFSEYGIRLCYGSKEEILGKGELKLPLQVQNNLINGVKVAERPLFLKEKVAKLKCNVHQRLDDFFKGYNAFFYDLIQPKERLFSFEGVTYKCVYKESKITGMLLYANSIWVDFDLSLTLWRDDKINTKIFDTTFDFTFE
ncbi:hypothetical protein CAPN004_10470 [Capnocytophaga cynodegmi]|nr:hypothetical protein CAPN004_10470 [Capnocytophaga cynodegmi]